MSGVVAEVAVGGSPPDADILRRMLARMAGRGGEHEEVWQSGGVGLGATRFGWEMGKGFSEGALVARDGELAVVADASLYYRDELRRALTDAGAPPPGNTPSDLILAAYRAWGERCPEHLEGDFAFLLWDTGEQRLLCARDFGGKRPLFYAREGGSVLVASTIGALLAHPRCPADLNLVAIAADAAALFAVRDETCRRAVRVLPAGCSLVATREGTVRIRRHWSPPPIGTESHLGFKEAADVLRGLLRGAVRERLAGTGPTSVWLSGGWDSSAVFAAGEKVLKERGEGERFRAVSISYPPGDPGREDEIIQSIADRWNSPVHWLQIGDIPLLDHPRARAACRDEPFAHAFEMLNRTLAAGSRAVGARVALDGNGGDQLFQVSNVYFADLLRSGRWRSLVREWRAKGMAGAGARTFFRWAMQPLLPTPLLSLATFLRAGRPLRGNWERPVPDWFEPRFMRKYRLLERERVHAPPRTLASPAAHETFWYLSYPYFPRVFGSVGSFALEAGVEIRSPLLDRKVVEFAASRPYTERSAGRETKRLLREAGHGLLPPEVLAPRAVRTGVTSAYLDRSLRRIYAGKIDRLIRAPLLLAEFGIVDPVAFRRRWTDYLRSGEGNLGVNLFLTLQAELWLRAHQDSPQRRR